MKESDLTHQIQMIATYYGGRLFRNNCGQHETKDGRWIKYGIANPGGSDLIGWMPGARFTAVEVKTGRLQLTSHQKNFIEQVIKHGGIAGCVRSMTDFHKLMEDFQCRPAMDHLISTE